MVALGSSASRKYESETAFEEDVVDAGGIALKGLRQDSTAMQ
jgi:hypothetical protein